MVAEEYQVIRTEQYVEDVGQVVVYGLMHSTGQNHSIVMQDISCNYKLVSELADTLTRNHASELHATDIIYDAVANEWM